MKYLLALYLLMQFLYVTAQNYSLTFGADSAIIRCTTPYTGSVARCAHSIPALASSGYSVRFITANQCLVSPLGAKCQFEIKNPGDVGVGSGSEVRFVQDDYPDLRLQVSDFIASPVYQFSFKVKIHKQSLQHWSYPSLYFYFGNSTSKFLSKNTTVPFNGYPEDTAIFGLVRFRSDGLVPNYTNAIEMLQGSPVSDPNVPTPSPVKLMTQGVTHTVSVFANTSADSVMYISPVGFKKVPPYSYDVFVDSLQIRTSVKNTYYRGGALNAFSWYVRDPNYFAPIIIDDVEWSPFISATPLPVKLITFDARVCDDTRAVCLSWATELEIDNSHFVIERSSNGITFDSIGVVAGFGTATIRHNYVFRDTDPDTNRLYYRLRQVDFDGASAFSPLQFVYVPPDDESCYPNLLELFDGTWKLYDTTGREVVLTEAGFGFAELHGLYVAAKLEDGIYVCRTKVWF